MLTQARTDNVLDHPWRMAALAAIVANIAFSTANDRAGIHGRSVAEVTSSYPSLFTPAGFVFAIWGLIWAVSLVYAVLSVLPRQLEVRMHDEIAPWFVLINVLGATWVYVFRQDEILPSVVIISAMLVCAWMMYQHASQHIGRGERMSLGWRAPFSLWLGWLTVAVIANVSVGLLAAGWEGEPFSPVLWACAMLLFAALLCWGVSVVYRDAVVPLTVGWGALGIAVARWDDSTVVAVVAALVALKTLIWAVVTLVLKRVPAPPRYSEQTLAGRYS